MTSTVCSSTQDKHAPPMLKDYPVAYMMPLPSCRTEMDADELQPVRIATPLPDLLPRTAEEIKRMREWQKLSELRQRYVSARRDLPLPYVNDDENDEFEDYTIDTTIDTLPENERLLIHSSIDNEEEAVMEASKSSQRL
uniref:Glutamate receptor 1.3 n=1 Tax=Lygus hesperus TaxID=30085 RepID=A0A0A9XEE0_LYGHE